MSVSCPSLTATEIRQQTWVEIPNINFHENRHMGVALIRSNGHTETKKSLVTFHLRTRLEVAAF